jgi:hypothetical protein
MIDALIKRVSVTYKCYEMYAHRGKGATARVLRSIKIAAINLLSSRAFFQSSIIFKSAVWQPKPGLNAERRG